MGGHEASREECTEVITQGKIPVMHNEFVKWQHTNVTNH